MAREKARAQLASGVPPSHPRGRLRLLTDVPVPTALASRLRVSLNGHVKGLMAYFGFAEQDEETSARMPSPESWPM